MTVAIIYSYETGADSRKWTVLTVISCAHERDEVLASGQTGNDEAAVVWKLLARLSIPLRSPTHSYDFSHENVLPNDAELCTANHAPKKDKQLSKEELCIPMTPAGDRPLSGGGGAVSSLFSNMARRLRTPPLTERFWDIMGR